MMIIVPNNKLEEKEYQKFINKFLPNKLLQYSKSIYSDVMFQKLNEYFKDTLQLDITVKDLLKEIFYSLKRVKDSTQDYLFINNVEQIGPFKLSQLARLVEKGNLNMKGIPVISKSFNYVNKNMLPLIIEFKNSIEVKPAKNIDKKPPKEEEKEE